MKTELEEHPERYTILDPKSNKPDEANDEKYRSLVEKIKKQAEGQEVSNLEINDERAIEIKNLKEKMDQNIPKL